MVAYTGYQSDNRVIRYAQALRERGDQVDVIALRGKGGPRKTTVDGVTLYGIQRRSRAEKKPIGYLAKLTWFLFKSGAFLSFLHLKRRYDVIHVHSIPDYEVFAALLPRFLGAKVILDIHDLVPEFYATKFRVSMRSRAVRLLMWTERASAAFSDHVIVANDLWLERLVRRSAYTTPATALINYPDMKTFFPRERAERNGQPFVAIYPGSLNYHQGVDIAVRAFAKVAGEVPSAEFHIYGQGGQRPYLEKLVASQSLGNVVLFKPSQPIPKIAEIVAGADLGVVPKRAEGFGNEAFSTKILEMMACGVPVVAARTMVDQFYFDDSQICFFEPGNEEDLAQRIIDLYNAPERRRSQREAGLRHVDSNNWEKKRHMYLDIVDGLVRPDQP